jgi:putative hydrolase of the HAD superfamily
MKKIQVIGFDADDTLWDNEPYFLEATKYFCDLLGRYASCEQVENHLFRTEVGNIELYGYGAKSFILSMIETALEVSNRKVSADDIERIIELGKGLVNKPVKLLDGVTDVLDDLYRKDYRLIVATKGDLLDQQRKLRKSGLEGYFHHIEIMSDKQEEDYRKLLTNLEVAPGSFMMVGNSLKSDILPVLKLGAYGVHVPYHTTWKHEEAEVDLSGYTGLRRVDSIGRIPDIIMNGQE